MLSRCLACVLVLECASTITDRVAIFSFLVALLLFLEELPPALLLRRVEETRVNLDVADSSLFVVGGAASDFFFAMLDFFAVEVDRLFGAKDFLGLLVCLGLVVLLLLLIGIDSLVRSLSLPLPTDFPNHFDFFLGLADLDVGTELDLRASGSSLGLSSFVGLNALVSS